MPLARLSVKAALLMAQKCVSLRVDPASRFWTVRTRLAGGIHVSERMGRAQAKAERRRWRIFMALTHLGVPEGEAMRAADKAAGIVRDWRKVVHDHMEKRSLMQPKA